MSPRLKKVGADTTDVKNYRPVSNLTFILKIVERVVCNQLVAYLEQNQLLPKHQSAYRKFHSTETAVLKLVSDILLAADGAEVTLLGLFDLSAAFDTVDHTILLERLRVSFGLGGSVLSWITSFICDRTQTAVFNRERSRTVLVISVVPQGSVLGPLLFLLYTADVLLITQRHGLKAHSYADDIQIHCLGKADSMAIVISRVVACINDIGEWMTGSRLKLNTDKTQFIRHGTRVQLSKVSINEIELDGVSIPMSTTVRCLGVMLDGELSFAEHIKQLSNGCFYQLRQLWSIRRLLTKESAKTLVHATILSRVDYCNSVLNRVCAVHLRPLHSVLRSAARLVLQVRKYDHISTAIRDDLHWLPVGRRIEFKTCALVYNCLHGVASEYLSELMVTVAMDVGRRHLRSATHGDLIIPASRTKTFGPRAFAIAGPQGWNNVAMDLHDSSMSYREFCSKLRTYLYRQVI